MPPVGIAAREVSVAPRSQEAMRYRIIADVCRQLESATGRLKMIALLADLFRETPSDLLAKVVYLCQGKIAPDFAGVELGLAEKLAMRAVAEASGVSDERIAASLRRIGDLGAVAEQLLAGQTGGRPRALQVDEVLEHLEVIARASGTGAQAHKISILARLIRRATPREARYLIRTVTGTLRLGVGDALILDALAEVYAEGRAHRPSLERAYNITSDLGLVAQTVARGGVQAVERLTVQPGNPVRPMLAQRLATPEEILRKLGGTCIAEFKYDGERVQIHRHNDEFTLFSRRLERITDQFPDAVDLVRAGLGPRSAILEAEVVAVDPASGDIRPFQELMRRRRKHKITEMVRRYPVGLFAFDLLYLDGRDLTRVPYPQRREALRAGITPSERLRLASQTTVHTPQEVQAYFTEAIASGCEGLICKSIGPDSIYQAGARGWQWIKYKREYQTALQDTLDLVVVGAFHGRGKRRGAFGALLLAAYDKEKDVFSTVCKVGTGFTDADLAELPKRLAPYQSTARPPRVDSKIEPDVWFEPGLVLEVTGAEMTLSPVHTAGWGTVRDGAGLALRFPRFTGRYREDKAPQDATTVEEISQLFHAARRRAKTRGGNHE
jgi:DNA ligase 1